MDSPSINQESNRIGIHDAAGNASPSPLSSSRHRQLPSPTTPTTISPSSSKTFMKRVATVGCSFAASLLNRHESNLNHNMYSSDGISPNDPLQSTPLTLKGSTNFTTRTYQNWIPLQHMELFQDTYNFSPEWLKIYQSLASFLKNKGAQDLDAHATRFVFLSHTIKVKDNDPKTLLDYCYEPGVIGIAIYDRRDDVIDQQLGHDILLCKDKLIELVKKMNVLTVDELIQKHPQEVKMLLEGCKWVKDGRWLMTGQYHTSRHVLAGDFLSRVFKQSDADFFQWDELRTTDGTLRLFDNGNGTATLVNTAVHLESISHNNVSHNSIPAMTASGSSVLSTNSSNVPSTNGQPQITSIFRAPLTNSHLQATSISDSNVPSTGSQPQTITVTARFYGDPSAPGTLATVSTEASTPAVNSGTDDRVQSGAVTGAVTEDRSETQGGPSITVEPENKTAVQIVPIKSEDSDNSLLQKLAPLFIPPIRNPRRGSRRGRRSYHRHSGIRKDHWPRRRPDVTVIRPTVERKPDVPEEVTDQKKRRGIKWVRMDKVKPQAKKKRTVWVRVRKLKPEEYVKDTRTRRKVAGERQGLPDSVLKGKVSRAVQRKVGADSSPHHMNSKDRKTQLQHKDARKSG